MRITAFRAMRRAGLDVSAEAARLARDPDAGVRREVALSLRDVPAAGSLDILVDIARGYDGQDRFYLEALGTGATGKEVALYDRLRRDLKVGDDPLTWSAPFARLAWRLHVPAAVPDLAARAQSARLTMADRRLALDTLAFIDEPAASQAMLALAAPSSPFREMATWWLLNRMSNSWASHNLAPALKTAGIYDPDAIALQAVTVPPAPADLPVLDVATDRSPHRQRAAWRRRSQPLSHVSHDRRRRRRTGPRTRRLGPWQVGRSHRHGARRARTPTSRRVSAGTELRTKDGLTIQGLLIKQGDPLMIRSMGGVTQIVPANRVAGRRNMGTSLMMSAAQLGLTAQDVADVVAFLRTE